MSMPCPVHLTRLAILMLDIERAEYEALDDILGAGIHPPQTLVKFDQLQRSSAASRAREQERGQLGSAGYQLVHCEGLSCSFVPSFFRSIAKQVVMVTERPEHLVADR